MKTHTDTTAKTTTRDHLSDGLVNSTPTPPPKRKPKIARSLTLDCLSPPKLNTAYDVLSLGGGVQSSALALMAATGQIGPPLLAAVFADTQAEPKSVYTWLDWLDAEIQKSKHPFPIYRVTAGSLTDQVLQMRVTADGRRFSATDIPIFTRGVSGIVGKIPHRSCTRDYKIVPVLREVRRLCGIKHKQSDITVTQWIGISYDEIERMKESRERWAQNRWPLVEQRITRTDCFHWMQANGYPEPPRSSCIYCPFHSDAEWRRLRQDEPESWQFAIEFEKSLQHAKSLSDNFSSMPYLHRSCQPLATVDLSTDADRGQRHFGFLEECEGMCGV